MTGQFVRFGLVGVVNTGTYYLSYLALLWWFPYLAAHVMAFALSTVGSYFLNVYITYRTRPAWRTFLLFPLTTVANFTITTGGVYVLVDLAGMNSKAAPLIAAAAAVPITFIVSRMIMVRPAAEKAACPGEEPPSLVQR
ncbi:GtrA family protein [Streptomyces zagrosensis]|uniref:GtrA family protein n=1 Tax=Streptomyces zagrosensis TaxID=1042984 RepID=UPI00160CE1E4|nr:GtrA family protein [Streptomyces zagrosensis]